MTNQNNYNYWLSTENGSTWATHHVIRILQWNNESFATMIASTERVRCHAILMHDHANSSGDIMNLTIKWFDQEMVYSMRWESDQR